MKTRNEWKERVHGGLGSAIETGIDVAEISRHSDVTSKSLYAFLRKKTLGPDNLRKLATWLRSEGFLPPDFRIMEAPAAFDNPDQTPPSIEWLAGQELINLGLFLQSDAATDWKIEKYATFIEHAHAHLKVFRAQLKKGSK